MIGKPRTLQMSVTEIVKEQEEEDPRLLREEVRMTGTLP